MIQLISSREELDNLIVTSRCEGWSIRQLVRRFNISRNTVRAILRKHRAVREIGPGAEGNAKTPRASKLDRHLELIKELLRKFPDITTQRVFEEIRIDGYTGGMTILRDRLVKLRPRPKRDPIIRFETDPGEQGQMDWSPYTIDFERGGRKEVLCFSYVLGFSRRHYIDFTLNRQFPTLIRRHADAFAYFGGVPRQCLYDGEKTVILRWEAGRPIFNPAFIVFITHYECRPVACRPRTPRTKGKVEAPFQYVEGNLLNGRRFLDFDHLRATARWWMAEISDKHRHDTTGRPPLELFQEQEQEALQALPSSPYDTAEVRLLLCDWEGFVCFETNRYSVSHENDGEILTLKATEHEIFIFNPELQIIAHHPRHHCGEKATEESPEHRAHKKIRYGLEPVRERFIDLGETAEEFLAGLTAKMPRNAGFHARYILRLKERYHCDDIHRALRHAATYHAFDAKAVERILTSRAQPRSLESLRNEKASEELRQSLPKIKQRSLDQYQDLFSGKEEDAP